MNKIVIIVFYDKRSGKVLSEKRPVDDKYYPNELIFPGETMEQYEKGDIVKTIYRGVKEEFEVKPVVFISLGQKPLISSKGNKKLYPFLVTKWKGILPKIVVDNGNPLIWQTFEEASESSIPTRSQIVNLVKDHLALQSL